MRVSAAGQPDEPLSGFCLLFILSIGSVPDQPTNPSVVQQNATYLMFQWNPPANIGTGNYSVNLTSAFWGQNWFNTTSQTSYAFSNLTSGSNYIFEVRTLAGNLSSDPATMSAMTGEKSLFTFQHAGVQRPAGALTFLCLVQQDNTSSCVIVIDILYCVLYAYAHLAHLFMTQLMTAGAGWNIERRVN